MGIVQAKLGERGEMSDDRWQQTELTKDEKIEWLRAENARLVAQAEAARAALQKIALTYQYQTIEEIAGSDTVREAMDWGEKNYRATLAGILQIARDALATAPSREGE